MQAKEQVKQVQKAEKANNAAAAKTQASSLKEIAKKAEHKVHHEEKVLNKLVTAATKSTTPKVSAMDWLEKMPNNGKDMSAEQIERLIEQMARDIVGEQ